MDGRRFGHLYRPGESYSGERNIRLAEHARLFAGRAHILRRHAMSTYPPVFLRTIEATLLYKVAQMAGVAAVRAGVLEQIQGAPCTMGVRFHCGSLSTRARGAAMFTGRAG